MQLTVLGCSPASTNPSGASSSYLVEAGQTRLLLDCGSGSFGRLIQYLDPATVDAIVISHMHADHTLDLIPYRYALSFAGGAPPKPALYLPPEGHAKLLGVSKLQDDSATFFSDQFAVAEYDPTATLRIGSLSVSFVPVYHVAHTYAVRVQGRQATLAYSADTGPCAAIYDAARGADLFLCECANPASSDYAYHLTAAQAGEIAATALARRLVLTHRWYRTGLDDALAEARAAYSGPVELAREGAIWHI